MNIETRLAKLDGINKSRLEKVQSAKAYAIKHFGTDSLTALQMLHENISKKESVLSDLNMKANEHLASCLDKLENNIALSAQDIHLAENFIVDQNRIKEEIQNLIANASSLSTDDETTINSNDSDESMSPDSYKMDSRQEENAGGSNHDSLSDMPHCDADIAVAEEVKSGSSDFFQL